MPAWLKALGVDSVARAVALKGLRWVAHALGVAVGAWLVTHHASQTDAADFVEGLTTLILSGGSMLFSILDATGVSTKIIDARVDGAKIAVANPNNVAQVVTIARKDPLELATLLNSLKAQ